MIQLLFIFVLGFICCVCSSVSCRYLMQLQRGKWAAVLWRWLSLFNGYVESSRFHSQIGKTSQTRMSVFVIFWPRDVASSNPIGVSFCKMKRNDDVTLMGSKVSRLVSRLEDSTCSEAQPPKHEFCELMRQLHRRYQGRESKGISSSENCIGF